MTASKNQRSLKPVTLLKFFSADKNAEAVQRRTIFLFFQRLTLPVLRRTPPFGLSMVLVVARQRIKVGGKPKWFKVNISSMPSNKLSAALGYSFSSHCASFFNRLLYKKADVLQPIL
jgi:hypothetical protein